jgi:hypothetical protein
VYFFTAVIATSVAVWHTPSSFHKYVFVILGIGLLFDMLSIAIYITVFVTRRYSSAFPVIGLAFYVWAWLAFPQPVVLGAQESLLLLWLCKLPDLLVLVAFHALVHVSPEWLHRITKREIRHEKDTT